MNKYETIYCYFNNYTKEEIDSSIAKLSKEEQELLKLRFSNKLDNKYNRSFYYIISKIKVILKNKDNTIYSNGKKVTTIYQRLSKYSKEDIDYIISLLSYEDKKILYLRYGFNFDIPDTSNWDIKYKKDFENLIYKIEYYLKRKLLNKDIIIKQEGILTIYQIFKNYTKEEIDNVINSLSNDDKYLLYLRYGSNLEKIDTSNWKKEYKYRFYKILIPKIRTILRNTYNREDDDIEIDVNPKLKEKILEIEYLVNKENNILFDKFEKKEILIYILVMKMDGSYTINDLEKFFKMDEKNILNIIKKILSETINYKGLVKK